MQTLGNITIENKNKKNDKQEEGLTLIRTPHTKHSSHRGTKNFLRNNKLLFLVILLACLGCWIYFIPPNNAFAILPFILLLTSVFSILASFAGTKFHVFSTLFIFLFLVMSYFIGFDVINTLVLLSFIIGLSTLFRIRT